MARRPPAKQPHRDDQAGREHGGKEQEVDISFRETAYEAMRRMPGYPEVTALELGCGDGFLLERLSSDGVTARGTTYREDDEDYIRTRPYPAGLTIDYGIDLNRPLPYEDGRFDLVYSTEVIEHVEGHRNFVSEATRVLRPDGWIVLTTPNLHRLASRWQYLLTGLHETRREPIPWNAGLAEMEAYHHRPVEFPHLHWLLWQSSVRVESIPETGSRRRSRTLRRLLKPLSGRATRRAVFRGVTDDPTDREGREDLVRWLTARSLQISERLCVVGRKGRNAV
jgi:SAM-dependent methyltransferase